MYQKRPTTHSHNKLQQESLKARQRRLNGRGSTKVVAVRHITTITKTR